jgi:hypothetical protein
MIQNACIKKHASTRYFNSDGRFLGVGIVGLVGIF